MKIVLSGFLVMALLAVAACARPAATLPPTATPAPWATPQPWWSIVGYAGKPPFSIVCFSSKLGLSGSVYGPADAWIRNRMIARGLSDDEAKLFVARLWYALGNYQDTFSAMAAERFAGDCPKGDIYWPERGKWARYRISIGAIFLIPTLWGMMVALGGLAGLVGWDWFAFQVGYAAGYAIVQPYVWAGGDDYWTAKILTMVFTNTAEFAGLWR